MKLKSITSYKTNLFACCLCLVGLGKAFDVQSQDFEITPLNQHFFKTSSIDDPTTVYSQLQNINEDGSTFTQISDAQNRVIKTIETDLNSKTGAIEEVVKVFDQQGQLILRSEENKQNREKFYFYYQDGVQVAHVAHYGNNEFEIWRKSGANRYSSNKNDFEPSLFPNDKDWKKFVLKEKRFLQEAQSQGFEGTVILAFLIDKNGQRLKTEVANLHDLPPILSTEALRIGELFVGNYNPAIDYKGETVEAWLYLPIGFYYYK
ncbi:energy transducer TonB [Algoriphagus lutimaris]|uniref:energy transducer TonB n=1 Tax=Algoriphagus lutimaris TaxID=613197 RepID=UPI00196B32B3|nr:energy transducer TonB [Algoriphagus lutimaris]MBN3518525.1 energy transducer TonB [Algoriphagus lutimaris]